MNKELSELILRTDLGVGTKVQAMVVCELFDRLLSIQKQEEILEKARKIAAGKYHPIDGDVT